MTTPKKQLRSGWKKGESGNPAGRPKGSGITGTLRKAIAKESESILQSVIDAAKAGDMAAARMLLDRIVPSLKAEAAPVTIPGMSSGTLADRAGAALDAAAAGELAPDTAAALVAAVGTLARIHEIDELTRRVEALENTTPSKPR